MPRRRRSSFPPAAARRPGCRRRFRFPAGLAVLLALTAARAPAAENDEPRRCVLLTVQLRNPTATPLDEVSIRLPLPTTNAYQRIYGIACAPAPFATRKIPAGGRVDLFRLKRIPPGESAWIFCLIDCRLRNFAPHRIARAKPLPETLRAACLGPGYKVDPKAPEITKTASKIAPGRINDKMEIAKRINNWIVNRYTYELDDQQLDATGMCHATRGSCSELSRLFAVLARARGIPTRFVTGSRLRVDDEGYVDRVRHRWIELHVPKYGWFPVDISRNVAREDRNRHFGAIPARYLVFLRTAGLAGDPLASASFVLVNREATGNVVRQVRLTWSRDRGNTWREMIRRLGNATRSPTRQRLMAREILALKGPDAAPFLAMLLYPPRPPEDAAQAIRKLEALGLRYAASPLVDRVAARENDTTGKKTLAALRNLTGETFATGDEWRLWLRGNLNRLFQLPPAAKHEK